MIIDIFWPMIFVKMRYKSVKTVTNLLGFINLCILNILENNYVHAAHIILRDLIIKEIYLDATNTVNISHQISDMGKANK